MAENELSTQGPGTGELEAEIARLRSEKEELQAQLDRQAAGGRKGRFPWRGTVAWALIVLACLASIVSPIAVWARAVLLDTEQFVGTVGPLIEEEEVARALSNEIAGRLFVGLDVERRVKDALDGLTRALQDALPDRLDALAGKLDFIAGPLTGELLALTQELTHEVLTSPRFQAAWKGMLRLSHGAAVRVIKGETALDIEEGTGRVTLDVGELADAVRDRLVEAGLYFLEKVPVPQRTTTLVLFDSSQLGMVRQGIDILNALNWLLPLLALSLFAAAVLVSEDRRRCLMICGAALAAAMAFSLTALNLAQGELLGQVKNPANLAAATVVWNRVTAQVIKADAGLLLAGAIAAAGFAAAGPYGWAKRLRAGARALLSPERESRLAGKDSGPVGRFFARHAWGLRVSGAALSFGALWLLRPLTGARVVAVLGAFLAYLVVCELLRGRLPEAEGAAEEP